MSKIELPEMTKESLMYVNCTPDKGYPLRILMAHRSNCDVKWLDNTEGKESMNPLLILMNKHCDERAKLLDKAIATLRKFGNLED